MMTVTGDALIETLVYRASIAPCPGRMQAEKPPGTKAPFMVEHGNIPYTPRYPEIMGEITTSNLDFSVQYAYIRRESFDAILCI